MTDLHRILVPVDFSSASRGAIRYAAGLMVPKQAELHLLYVLPPPQLGFSMVELDPQEARSLSVERRGQALSELPAFAGGLAGDVTLCPNVTEGEPAAEIAAYAKRRHIDAIVMPTRGQGRLERLLLIGSVTMKVLHSLDIPVITAVRFEDHLPPQATEQVLCAVDLGPATERVVCAAARMAARLGARLTIAHAASVFGHAAGELYDDAWRDTVVKRVEDRLEQLKQRLHVKADIRVALDQPPRAVSRLALELGAGLVVLGRGASDDIIGRLRADAYDIIRLCHCPVVSV